MYMEAKINVIVFLNSSSLVFFLLIGPHYVAQVGLEM